MANDLRAIETKMEFPQYRRDIERNLTTQQAITSFIQTKAIKIVRQHRE